jgi:branched-chain amino acid transport system substrate-binding protein
LITRDRVQLLVGIVGSPTAAAVAPLTQDAKIPLIITNAAGTAIPRISPYVVRVSFTLWQQAYPLSQRAAKQGWKTAYTAVSDFIPGHDAEGAFTKGWTDAGLKVLGSVRFPTTNPDFAPFVQRIRMRSQTSLSSGSPAASNRRRCSRRSGTSAYDKQASTSSPPRISFLTRNCRIWVRSLGASSPPVPIPAPLIDQPTRPSWRPGTANMPAKRSQISIRRDGWDGRSAIFDLIKETKGKFTGDEAIKFLTNWKTADSPRGPISIDPSTRDIVQNIYMRRTEIKNGKLANIEFDTIPNVKDPWKELNPLK